MEWLDVGVGGREMLDVGVGGIDNNDVEEQMENQLEFVRLDTGLQTPWGGV